MACGGYPLTVSRVLQKAYAACAANRPATTTRFKHAFGMRSKLVSRVCCNTDTSPCQKVTVVGAGSAGMTCAYSLLLQRITGEICLIDKNKNVLRGELHDLSHASAFVKGVTINGSTDLESSFGSRVIVLTNPAGCASGEPDEQRLNDVRTTVARLTAGSPDAVLLVAADPTDLATHVTWTAAADTMSLSRVFGVGCQPETTRLRRSLAALIGLSSRDVHVWIIGHGGPDTSIACWSKMSVSGGALDFDKLSAGLDDVPVLLKTLLKQATTEPAKGIEVNGPVHGAWLTGVCASDIVRAILRNETVVKSVCTMMLGKYGINKEVFLSTPCVINGDGIYAVLEMNVDDCDKYKMVKLADAMHEKFKCLNLS